MMRRMRRRAPPGYPSATLVCRALVSDLCQTNGIERTGEPLRPRPVRRQADESGSKVGSVGGSSRALANVLGLVGIVCSLMLAAAVLVLPWHRNLTVAGGAVSWGRGLWGVGIRLEWIVPLVALAVLGLISAFLVRHRLWSAVLAACGVCGLALVIAVGARGPGFFVAILAILGLLATGLWTLLSVVPWSTS